MSCKKNVYYGGLKTVLKNEVLAEFFLTYFEVSEAREMKYKIYFKPECVFKLNIFSGALKSLQ
jgi:hypothetical protein